MYVNYTFGLHLQDKMSQRRGLSTQNASQASQRSQPRRTMHLNDSTAEEKAIRKRKYKELLDDERKISK